MAFFFLSSVALNVVWVKRMLVVFYSVVVLFIHVLGGGGFPEETKEERGKKKVKLGEKQRERGLIIWREGGGVEKVRRGLEYTGKLAELRGSLDLDCLQFPRYKYCHG